MRLNPDERLFRILQDRKTSYAIFIMVNAHQDGSAKNQISKLKLNETLNSGDKVFFVIEDFDSIINSGDVREMCLNISEYFDEFGITKNNKGLILINDDNPIYSLAFLENQINPCTSQIEEIKLLDLLELKCKFLFDNTSKVSDIIGSLIRAK